MKNKYKIIRVLAMFIIVVISFMLISSCVSRKKTILFQQKYSDTLVSVEPPYEYLIQNGDILYIKVQSLDAKASAFITGNSNENNTNEITESEQRLYFDGYEVTPKGMINLPYLDSLKVSGMTTDQISKMLTDSLSPFIKEAFISVKLASFRVSIFGEVQNSGTFLFYNTRVPIFNIISLAKPTEYYNATNVVVTRQTSDNQIKIGRIDLTSTKIMASPYYYLQPNDQIYIEPLKVKKYGFSTFPYTLLLSTISTIAILYSIFSK